MKGVPADMGDWDIKGVFQEAGRLLSEHLRDFLPIILVFIFPATLIKVLETQFFAAAFCGPPSTDISWLVLLLCVLLGLLLPLPSLLIPIAYNTMAQVLMDSICISDLKAERHSQSLYTRVKLSLNFRQFEQTGDSSQERFQEASKWKRLKRISAVFLCTELWFVLSRSGMYFTPEAVTAMGLPLRTVFLITLLIVTVTTVITSYSLLVGLVMFLWISSPKTHTS